MMLEFRVKTNESEFRRQMRELSSRDLGAATRAAGRAGAAVMRKAVRRAAPKRTGALRRAVFSGFMRRRSKGTPGTLWFTVGVLAGRLAKAGKGDPFYWSFLEAGWVPRGPGRALAGGAKFRALQRSRSTAVTKYRFLSPTFAATQAAASAAFFERFDREFAKRRQGKK